MRLRFRVVCITREFARASDERHPAGSDKPATCLREHALNPFRALDRRAVLASCKARRPGGRGRSAGPRAMKRTTSAILFAALSGTLAGPPASAQTTDFPDYDPYAADDVSAVSWRGDIGLVLLAGDTPDGGLDLLADIELGVDFETFTETGRRWGVVLTGHAERDLYGDQSGGRVGTCPPRIGDCATIGLAGTTAAPIAPDSGLYSAGAGSEDRSRAMISDGYVYTDTGWGELRLGYGAGAARLDPVGGPSAARLVRPDGGHTQAAGPAMARTETPHSGHDPKLVFRSIALGQASSVGTVRAALSFTPEVSQCGIDYCPRMTGPAGQSGAINRDVTEISITYSVRRGEHEWSMSTSASQAGRVEGAVGFEPVSGQDVGLSWRWNDWRAGGRWRRSNNGVDSDGDLEAWSASVGLEQGAWLTAMEFAAFSDDFIHADGRTWQAATSRLVGDNGLVAFGIQSAVTHEPVIEPAGRVQQATRTLTGFVELGWRF
jgi:hypothetical protein